MNNQEEGDAIVRETKRPNKQRRMEYDRSNRTFYNPGRKIYRRKVAPSVSPKKISKKAKVSGKDQLRPEEEEEDISVEENQQDHDEKEVSQAIEQLSLKRRKKKARRRFKKTTSDIELVLEIDVGDQRMAPFAVQLNEDYHEAALRFCRENQLGIDYSERLEATIRENINQVKDERKTMIKPSEKGSVLILEVDIGDVNGPRECRAEPDDDLLLVAQNFCVLHGLPKESVEILKGLLETNMITLQTEIQIAKLKQRRHEEQIAAIEKEKIDAERKEAQRQVDALADQEQKRRIAWYDARKSLHRARRSW